MIGHFGYCLVHDEAVGHGFFDGLRIAQVSDFNGLDEVIVPGKFEFFFDKLLAVAISIVELLLLELLHEELLFLLELVLLFEAALQLLLLELLLALELLLEFFLLLLLAEGFLELELFFDFELANDLLLVEVLGAGALVVVGVLFLLIVVVGVLINLRLLLLMLNLPRGGDFKLLLLFLGVLGLGVTDLFDGGHLIGVKELYYKLF